MEPFKFIAVSHNANDNRKIFFTKPKIMKNYPNLTRKHSNLKQPVFVTVIVSGEQIHLNTALAIIVT